jgi:hypothetical protein
VQASCWDARFTLLFPAMNRWAKVKRPAGTNAKNLFLEFYSTSGFGDAVITILLRFAKLCVALSFTNPVAAARITVSVARPEDVLQRFQAECSGSLKFTNFVSPMKLGFHQNEFFFS